MPQARDGFEPRFVYAERRGEGKERKDGFRDIHRSDPRDSSPARRRLPSLRLWGGVLDRLVADGAGLYTWDHIRSLCTRRVFIDIRALPHKKKPLHQTKKLKKESKQATEQSRLPRSSKRCVFPLTPPRGFAGLWVSGGSVKKTLPFSWTITLAVA
ncbi:hypothetical protein AKJ16_DCAP00682 [Drosera capensis]